MKTPIYNHCGKCEHWMKSSDCPREKREDSKNPSKIGLPTCHSVACDKYQLSTFYKIKP